MTPAEKAGWKVGDLGVIDFGDVKFGTFSKGAVVKLCRDTGDPNPLWTLVSGQCAYNNGPDGAPGAYYPMRRVRHYPGSTAFARTEESAYVVEDCQVNKEEKEPSTDDIWEQIKRSCN